MNTYHSSFVQTVKESPKDAEVISHQLLIRAGMIKKLASGIYSILPMGQRVFAKMNQIVREEMNRINGVECQLPCSIPSELWESSGRWDQYGKELLRFEDRQGRSFCFGPTHEEVITDLVSSFVSSYKQLPVLIYQIQTKFRDEIRPRFGLMRGREFLMKDAYSFHDTTDSLDSMYHRARDAYKQIFQRCGLTFIEAAADSGAIGGDESAEFLVVAQSGEDEILVNNEIGFAANIEACECLDVDFQHDSAIDEIESVKTPNIKTIADVSTFLKLESNACIKSILIIASDKPYLFCLPGNRELNEAKVMKVLNASFRFASSEEVVKYMGCSAGFIGPVNSKDIPLYFDYSLKELLYYCCGANRDDVHFRNVNLNRDVTHIHWVDIKNAAAGDPCVIDSSKSLSLTRGIEVGHVFKLNDKYSTAMSAKFNDSNGHSLPFQMGCYGIGIGRTIAATIEQSHDDNGIIWPEALSPFHVVIVHLCPDDDPMTTIVTNLVSEIESLGKDVIVDNRNESPGVKFKDADLIGFPYQIVIGRKVISTNNIEIKQRKNGQKTLLPLSEISNIGDYL